MKITAEETKERDVKEREENLIPEEREREKKREKKKQHSKSR